MIDYAKLYHIMVDGAEKALDAIEAINFDAAKKALIAAEQEAEALYIETAEAEDESVAPVGCRCLRRAGMCLFFPAGAGALRAVRAGRRLPRARAFEACHRRNGRTEYL